MTQQQRAALDTLLRAIPRNPEATVAEQRAGFAAGRIRPLADDVETGETTLGGRPALEVRVTGAPHDGTLLYLHGGGYAIGSPRTHAHLSAGLVRRTGLAAILPDYRLAPEHPFPAAVLDGAAAYRELIERGVPAERLVIAGDSAGGGLAIATLLRAREAGLPMPAAVVLFSPWADLTLTGGSVHGKNGVDPIFRPEDLVDLVRHYLGDGDPSVPEASPVLADLRGLPPLLIQVGSNELLLDDAIRLAARAGADGVAATLEVWPDLPHVFQHHVDTGTLDEADAALDAVAAFVAARLRQPAAV